MGLMLRHAVASDIPDIMALIRELAEYEEAPEEVTNTEERMLKEGFGENPAFQCILAIKEDRVVGMALYYFRYSTWKGRRLYLEDLIVTAQERGKGIGKALFDKTIQIAKEENCSGMMWQVLEWLESSFKFYERYNTRFDGDWYNCHLDF